jgi:hypothetical protein
MRLFCFIVVGFLVISSPAIAQDCLNPNGNRGDITYNHDFDVFQGCTASGGWHSFHESPCVGTGSCPANECTGTQNAPAVGQTCADGSIYAGLSPDGGVPMYTTPADAPSLIAWNDGTSNWVDTAMENCTFASGTELSCQTGEANTALLVGLSGSGSPAPYQAAEYCDGLTAHGHSDWYLPAQAELDVLYDNKNAGDLNGTFNETGSFPAGWYWSSSEFDLIGAWFQFFSDGTQLAPNKGNELSVRCVRR